MANATRTWGPSVGHALCDTEKAVSVCRAITDAAFMATHGRGQPVPPDCWGCAIASAGAVLTSSESPTLHLHLQRPTRKHAGNSCCLCPRKRRRREQKWPLRRTTSCSSSRRSPSYPVITCRCPCRKGE